MKNAVLSFMMTLFVAGSLLAQEDAYTRAMQAAIQQMESAEDLAGLQQSANQFERIAAMNQEAWLPKYYAGLNYIFMSFEDGLSPQRKDELLLVAEKHAGAASELAAQSPEVMVLKGYVKMAQLSVDPANRGMALTPQVTALFEKARAMDPQNPRALIMLARMKYGTAQFFKSSTDEACQLAGESVLLFEQAEPKGIEPHWGANLAKSIAEICSSNG